MRIRDGLELLAPGHCLACMRRGGARLCEACCEAAPHRPAGDDAWLGDGALDGCSSLLWLEGPVVEWVHRFKYPAPGWLGLDGPAMALARELARRLGERLCPRADDVVVPIPLHRRRLRARGFNPAAVVAHHALGRRGLAFAGRALVRARDTPSQTGLDRAGRRANVRGAFVCRPVGRWPPRRVWLVDDVVTTGATLAEAAETLRAAGVTSVVGVGLARTPASHTPGAAAHFALDPDRTTGAPAGASVC